MDSFIDLTSTNWSYYTIPAAFALCMLPSVYSGILAGKNYDLANPRNMLDTCAKDTTLDKSVLNRINRAKAASANGFETLGLYAAAVVAANSAKIDLVKLNKLTIGYIISRAAYNFVYVQLQENRRLASVRSIAWGVGIYSIISLFLSAGSALNLRA
ncbi:hypothetical protein QBC42DRAFT_277677 [Cladorrhinum samala]|uniref:Uncharacterized protein n=1 Tax=Cladorrhinum samala TaxID=585594 RepID=A0AAV9HAG8_9PEZI|nr:hypothetical protein QBC42DRAFT_277677 [Cladorrhinum samala]